MPVESISVDFLLSWFSDWTTEELKAFRKNLGQSVVLKVQLI